MSEPDWRRAAARRAMLPVVIAAIGVTVVIAGEGSLIIVGSGIIAVAVTVAIALVFLEIGYSEDRARNSTRPPTGRN